jgi:hypothetical protein
MSYITIRPESVTKACKGYYSDRNKKIKALQDKQIDKVMNRKLFAPKTREEAINKLKNYSPHMLFNKFKFVEMYDMGNCCKIDELFALANIAVKNNELITLSSEHAAILEKYFY